uniref:Uncharacterized protein n=1 Tax=Leersia perrieri TaxID=77586 RepID=A0A0D9X976_9ORYZ
MMEREQGGRDGEVGKLGIEQAILIAPATDDPNLCVLTFRSLFVGITGCIIISFVSVFTSFRQNPVIIPFIAILMGCLFLGKIMAIALPPKDIRIPWTRITFSLNPGPFNMKEHVVSYTIFSSGLTSSPVQDLFVLMRVYLTTMHPVLFFLLLMTTYIIPYGFATLFFKIYVNPPEMWCPEVLPFVSLFRTLHEEEKEVNSMGSLPKDQLLLLVGICSFTYYIVPVYLFPSISTLSLVCWIWKKSVLAHQLGSGMHGLGLGSIGFDWTTISSFTGNPLVLPFSAIVNMTAGFFLFAYIIVPIAYWTDSFKAKRFPLVSTEIYDSYGNIFSISKVLNEKKFEFVLEGYESYSQIYLSITRACSLGFEFACLASSLSEMALVHGRYFLIQAKKSFVGSEKDCEDYHVNVMKKYDNIPWWWGCVLLSIMTILAMLACEGFGNQIQLRYWGLLLAYLFVLVFLPPFSILRATTAQEPPLRFFMLLIIGYLYPGKPLGNMAFTSYSSRVLSDTLGTIGMYKLGHYLKIPPRALFFSQIIGALILTCTDYIATLWLFSNVENICKPDLLPKGSPWTCPYIQIAYSDMMIWGVIGPSRVFYPAAGAVNYISCIIFIFTIKFALYKKKEWWDKHIYLLSVGLDTGVALMAFLVMFALQMHDINGIDWWGLEVSDHCPLAKCPTQPGVAVEGCPVFL